MSALTPRASQPLDHGAFEQLISTRRILPLNRANRRLTTPFAGIPNFLPRPNSCALRLHGKLCKVGCAGSAAFQMGASMCGRPEVSLALRRFRTKGSKPGVSPVVFSFTQERVTSGWPRRRSRSSRARRVGWALQTGTIAPLTTSSGSVAFTEKTGRTKPPLHREAVIRTTRRTTPAQPR